MPGGLLPGGRSFLSRPRLLLPRSLRPHSFLSSRSRPTRLPREKSSRARTSERLIFRCQLMPCAAWRGSFRLGSSGTGLIRRTKDAWSSHLEPSTGPILMRLCCSGWPVTTWPRNGSDRRSVLPLATSRRGYGWPNHSSIAAISKRAALFSNRWRVNRRLRLLPNSGSGASMPLGASTKMQSFTSSERLRCFQNLAALTMPWHSRYRAGGRFEQARAALARACAVRTPLARGRRPRARLNRDSSR